MTSSQEKEFFDDTLVLHSGPTICGELRLAQHDSMYQKNQYVK